MSILLVPTGHHSKEVKNKIHGHIENEMTSPERKVPPLSRGVIMLGTMPSQYNWKFVPGLLGGKKMSPSHLRSLYLENTSKKSTHYGMNPKFFLLPPLTSSQIWLSPLGHDHQPTYSTNLKIKTSSNLLSKYSDF